MKTLDFKAFVQSYLATAAWVTAESGEETAFTREAQKFAEMECQKFIDLVKKEFGEEKAMELLTIPGNDLTYLAPHDFFLTRNGHGAGFWDKEEMYGDEEAAILTRIAKECGGVDCYHVRGKRSKLTFN